MTGVSKEQTGEFMIKINEESCIGCEACVKDCFGFNLIMENGKARALGRCMMCGHCVAVCPTNSVSLDGMPEEDIIEYRKEEFYIKPENLLNAIKFRRSVRQYKSDEVSREILERILEAGRYTATGGNRQDVAYTVVTKKISELKPLVWEGLGLLTQMQLRKEENKGYTVLWQKMYDNYKKDPVNDALFFGAPVLLVVMSDSKVNGALAASNIELQANAEGLGCLYSGFIEYGILSNPKAQQFLELGKSQIALCMIMGYADVQYQRTVPRKPLEIHWR